VTRILTAFERGGDQFVTGASSQAAGEPVAGHVRACATHPRGPVLARGALGEDWEAYKNRFGARMWCVWFGVQRRLGSHFTPPRGSEGF
jgi:hypothetical protein